jgi:hypothetical protein
LPVCYIYCARCFCLPPIFIPCCNNTTGALKEYFAGTEGGLFLFSPLYYLVTGRFTVKNDGFTGNRMHKK